MATRACAPQQLLSHSLRCFDFYIFRLAFKFRPFGACLKQDCSLERRLGTLEGIHFIEVVVFPDFLCVWESKYIGSSQIP